jgi:hypothetical protein
MGWIARAWTSIFPLTDWSFDLLAMTNAAIAIFAIDLISRRFVRGDKRAAILLLLMLLPAYHFYAEPFNADTVLLAAWPIATYCFLRSFEMGKLSWLSGRSAIWATAAGATAALALLGKYYSIFLIGSFVLAAVCHPSRRDYLTSSSPWIATFVGLLLLSFHFDWLLNNAAPSLQYPIGVHGASSLVHVILRAAEFLLISIGYLAIPTATWILISESQAAFSFFKNLRKVGSQVLLLLFVGIGLLVLPVITAITLKTYLHSHWSISGLFPFVIVLVAGSATFSINRLRLADLGRSMSIVMLILLVVGAPSYAIYHNLYPFEDGRNFYREAANRLTARWHEISDRPLLWVSGFDGLAFAAEFYGADHPLARPFGAHYERLSPIKTVLDEGAAVLCFAEDDWCVSHLEEILQNTTGAIRFDFAVQSRLFEWRGASRGIAALIVPYS